MEEPAAEDVIVASRGGSEGEDEDSGEDSSGSYLLRAALSPETGGLSWKVVAEAASASQAQLRRHPHTLAPLRLWYPPMLNDHSRADLYAAAIASAVAQATARCGRPPIVLDLGKVLKKLAS